MEDRNLEELYQAIYKRKSIRKYEEEKLSENELKGIKSFLKQVKALDPEIKFEAKIVNSEAVKSIIPIKSPHYCLLYTSDAADE